MGVPAEEEREFNLLLLFVLFGLSVDCIMPSCVGEAEFLYSVTDSNANPFRSSQTHPEVIFSSVTA